MENAYYSAVAIFAIILHVIINFDSFNKNGAGELLLKKSLKRFLFAVFLYYVSDAAWGIFNYSGLKSFLYGDTIIYYLTMGFSVVFWCQYVVEYLRLNNIFGKILNIVSYIFLLAQVTMLVINHFFHIFFWFNSAGEYEAYNYRYITFYFQLFLFLTIAIQAILTVVKNKRTNRQNKIIILCCFVMVIAVLGQTKFLLLPVYSVGLILANCILHVFVQEDERVYLNKKLIEHNNIIANAGLGIWYIFNTPGKEPRMQANEKMCELLGIKNQNLTEEEIYSSWYEHIVPDAIPSVQKSVQEMMEGKYSENTYQWLHKTKGVIYVRCGGTGKKLVDGTWVLSGFHMDATESVYEEQKQKRELENARDEAKIASQAKTTFLFNMSHDIRTPMNAITGFTELLKNNLDNKEKSEKYIQNIQDSSNFLLSLINNVLEMARIESGLVSYEEEPNNIHESFRSFISVFKEQMEVKGLKFKYSCEIENENVFSDSVIVKEIYLNLLSNAMKYTPAGGSVEMKVKQLSSDRKGYGLYEVSIKDTGIGMSKEFLPHLFDEFAREHTVTENKIEGTGLGMPIVKKLIESIGGSITVESELGKGSTFVVKLYHRINNDAVTNKSEAQDIDYSIFKGKRILLAEDNALNAEIAIEILKSAGFETDLAQDGIICVDMYQKAAAGYYDLILMDIQMPNMNGFKAAQFIRAMEDPEKNGIPIIAMTANAFEEDKHNAFKNGMNGHLAKPIETEKMFRLLAVVLQK